MLDEKLRNAWHARERAVPLSSAPHLEPNGLVFGVGTVVMAAEGARRLRSVRGQEARVLALLSAAYRRPVHPAVLGNIERAGKSWSEGDDLLAHIHLAHGGLRALSDPREAAFRLFITESLMNVGVSPRSIFEALEVGAPYIDAVEKLYNEDEPRVPSGSGRTSGEWTRELSFLPDFPLPQPRNSAVSHRAFWPRVLAAPRGWRSDCSSSHRPTSSVSKGKSPACRV